MNFDFVVGSITIMVAITLSVILMNNKHSGYGMFFFFAVSASFD